MQKDEDDSSEQWVHYYYVITSTGNRQAMIELADYEKHSINEPYRQMWAVSTAGVVFVVHPQGQVAAYDTSDGTQLWVNDTIRWQPDSYTADPISGDLAITGKAAEFGSDDYWPSAARINTRGQYLWTRRNIKAIHGFTQGSLTIATGTRDQLVAISPQGETAWERPLGGEISFTLAAASGEIYVAQRK